MTDAGFSSKAERIPEVTVMLEKIGDSAGHAAHFNVRFLHCRDLSETANAFSARFDNSSGWEVGAYVPQDIPNASDLNSKREEARSMLVTGQPWQRVVEETGLSRASVFRIKKEVCE